MSDSHPESEAREVLTTEQAAELLQCSAQKLEIARKTGNGPPFVRMGRMIRYRRTGVLAWLADQETHG